MELSSPKTVHSRSGPIPLTKEQQIQNFKCKKRFSMQPTALYGERFFTLIFEGCNDCEACMDFMLPPAQPGNPKHTVSDLTCEISWAFGLNYILCHMIHYSNIYQIWLAVVQTMAFYICHEQKQISLQWLASKKFDKSHLMIDYAHQSALCMWHCAVLVVLHEVLYSPGNALDLDCCQRERTAKEDTQQIF